MVAHTPTEQARGWLLHPDACGRLLVGEHDLRSKIDIIVPGDFDG